MLPGTLPEGSDASDEVGERRLAWSPRSSSRADRGALIGAPRAHASGVGSALSPGGTAKVSLMIKGSDVSSLVLRPRMKLTKDAALTPALSGASALGVTATGSLSSLPSSLPGTGPRPLRWPQEAFL